MCWHVCEGQVRRESWLLTDTELGLSYCLAVPGTVSKPPQLRCSD